MIEEACINDFINNYIDEYKNSIKNDKYLSKYYDKLVWLIEDIPINYNKGNISINMLLLYRYENVKDMINGEISNVKKHILLKNIKELENINLTNLDKTKVYHLAINIFDKYNKTCDFFNNGKIIKVSHADIKECVKKIYNANQIGYLKEHLLVFSNIKKIIGEARMVSQSKEDKKDIQNTHLYNNLWSYYVIGIVIDNINYLLEFDVVSRDNGENHYRVERIQKTDISAGNINNDITPTLETSVS